MKGLKGKIAVVTGGSSGIGQAIAIRLGEEGVNVAVNYVGPVEGAEATKEAIDHSVDICMKKMSESGRHPMLVRADVSSEDEVARMFDRVLEEYGRIDYLINNAGVQAGSSSLARDATSRGCRRAWARSAAGRGPHWLWARCR
jgi:glucose 1-dehydrogenase